MTRTIAESTGDNYSFGVASLAGAPRHVHVSAAVRGNGHIGEVSLRIPFWEAVRIGDDWGRWAAQAKAAEAAKETE